MERLNINNGDAIRVLNNNGRYRQYTTFFLRNKDTLQSQLGTTTEDGEYALADIIEGFYMSQNREMDLSHPYIVLCRAMHHNGNNEILVLRDSINGKIFLVHNDDRYIAKGVKLSEVREQMDNVFIQLDQLKSLINCTGADCEGVFDELHENVASILDIYSDYILD